jgi:hypothetical protein
MGFHVEAAHHEVAPGQHEIDFRYDDVLTTADNISTFRFVVKNVANRNGLHATFHAQAHRRHQRKRHAYAPGAVRWQQEQSFTTKRQMASSVAHAFSTSAGCCAMPRRSAR